MFTTLRQVLILGGRFEQEGSGGKGGRGGGTLQYVRGKYYSLNVINLTAVAIMHPFTSPACYSRRFDVRWTER